MSQITKNNRTLTYFCLFDQYFRFGSDQIKAASNNVTVRKIFLEQNFIIYS